MHSLFLFEIAVFFRSFTWFVVYLIHPTALHKCSLQICFYRLLCCSCDTCKFILQVMHAVVVVHCCCWGQPILPLLLVVWVLSSISMMQLWWPWCVLCGLGLEGFWHETGRQGEAWIQSCFCENLLLMLFKWTCLLFCQLNWNHALAAHSNIICQEKQFVALKLDCVGIRSPFHGEKCCENTAGSTSQKQRQLP